jgi:hypothetical protein
LPLWRVRTTSARDAGSATVTQAPNPLIMEITSARLSPPRAADWPGPTRLWA